MFPTQLVVLVGLLASNMGRQGQKENKAADDITDVA